MYGLGDLTRVGICSRYHCYTCNMFDGIGICSVCAKVCHKDHEVSYAKYSSFFCDCGAKEDGSCQVNISNSSLYFIAVILLKLDE